MLLRTILAVPALATLCIAQTDLYQPTTIWNVHLSLTQEQYKAMEPGRRSGGGFSFGQGEWLQGPEGKRNGLASAMGVEFKTARAALTINDIPLRDVAVRYKGNGTFLEGQGAGKFSYKVDLNEFVKGQTFAGVTKLNFHSNVTDGSWMNEVLSYRLYRDAGVPAPRTAYAKLYLTVPGQAERRYLGLYSLVENVDSTFTGRHFTNKGGAIFKPVSVNLFRYLGEDWAKYNQTYDPKDPPTEAQKKRVIDFTRLVSRATAVEFAEQIGSFVDLEGFARYMAVMVFLSDLDGILGPGQNFYLYLDPKTNKFSFVPWDQDHSFGQFPIAGNQQQREQLSIHKPWMGKRSFLEKIFEVEAFKKLYLAKLAEFSRTLFEPERFTAQVDEIAAAIRPAVKEESSDKLARLERAVAGTSRSVVPIKPFVRIRAKSIADQLAGKSKGEQIREMER